MKLSERTKAAIAKGPQPAYIGKDGVGVETSTMFATRIAQMAAEDAIREAVKMCDDQAALWLDSANASGALMGCKREILSLLGGGDRG